MKSCNFVYGFTSSPTRLTSLPNQPSGTQPTFGPGHSAPPTAHTGSAAALPGARFSPPIRMTEQQWAQCVAYRRCPPRALVHDFAFDLTPQLRHPHAWSLTYTCRARLRGTRRAAPASRRHSSAHCSGRLAPRTPSMPAVPSLPALPTRACDRGRGSVQVCCDVDPLGRKRLRDGGLSCAGYVKSSQVKYHPWRSPEYFLTINNLLAAVLRRLAPHPPHHRRS